MALEFSNITDEETSRPYRQHLSYSTSYIVFDSEDVEYTSSIRTSTRPAVNVGNLQPIITRAPARPAHGSALRQPPLRSSTERWRSRSRLNLSQDPSALVVVDQPVGVN